MAIAATYLSSTAFSVPGDLTAEFAPGARVLADCGADGLRYGTVVGVSASGGATTVSLTLDAGTLTANLTGVRHGNDVPDSLCNHAAQHAAGGRDPLAAASTEAPGVAELATNAEGVAGTDAARVVPVAVARQQFTSWMRDAMGEFPGVIPPAYNLFAPKLDLPGTTTFSRASSAWRLGAAGSLREAAVGVPRFDYDASGNLLGLRIEGAATRLNTIAAAPTAPENVSVSAVAYTLSFFGTGSMTLSGAHAATINGTGALPARVSYTFTPTAGTLTLTPSGTVQHLQVEAGAFATSPILGEGSAVARTADVATVALSGIDFNTAEGTIYCEFRVAGVSVQQRIFYIDNNSSSNVLSLFVSASNKITMAVASGGTTVVYTEASSTVVANTVYKVAFSFRNNNYQLVVNGGPAVSDTSGAMPSSLVTIRLGQGLSNVQPMFGVIRHFAYFPRALTTAQLQAMTL
ncbi:LamG domain-containing protein [Desulfovibrio sulfodismutans]|uniref:LamG domain-containing protein n=1 Tax=Desulfolutivibrio sulfodismutans TaxID=63561 RepID=A0A7K3NKX4_9BACT|nr:LamG domain-containing protein [Desulfolutivibrio sulfodismutans]NDY56767.1 LamG domain-containing protein [Desulfolutivibrio sulfodismutans]QLA13311.1 hypothetical protein GD606_14090 [Desulfolutivibrio sulfodismutans DSM 3696]